MTAIARALAIAGSMTWEILWALILGFMLSAVVQAVVRRSTIIRLLGDDRPKTLTIAAGLGAASSSCSYAAVALARSLFRKGAHFTAAMAFEIASTNLVIELGVILALLMGWQFTVMEWAAIWKDLVGGLLIAGAIAAWVPDRFWRTFFLTGHPLLSKIWGPLIGPIVAMLSFVCSIGNVPLAAVLWNGGISFGGVVAFIFADLIILPIINIYRKYYGWRTAIYLTATFYLAMVTAGYAIEILFGVTGLTRTGHDAKVVDAAITWNYTTWLNIVFLLLAAVMTVRFLRTGGRSMLTMMGGVPEATEPAAPGRGGQEKSSGS